MLGQRTSLPRGRDRRDRQRRPSGLRAAERPAGAGRLYAGRAAGRANRRAGQAQPKPRSPPTARRRSMPGGGCRVASCRRSPAARVAGRVTRGWRIAVAAASRPPPTARPAGCLRAEGHACRQHRHRHERRAPDDGDVAGVQLVRLPDHPQRGRGAGQPQSRRTSWSGSWPPSGKRPTRPPGASRCARTSSSMTARRSTPRRPPSA